MMVTTMTPNDLGKHVGPTGTDIAIGLDVINIRKETKKNLHVLALGVTVRPSRLFWLRLCHNSIKVIINNKMTLFSL